MFNSYDAIQNFFKIIFILVWGRNDIFDIFD